MTSRLDDDWSGHDWTRPAPPVAFVPAHPGTAPTTVGATLPPVVVVPAHPGPHGVQLELTLLGDGTAAVVAFSTVAGLVAELGRNQPWAMLPASTVLTAGRRAAAVVLDPAPGVCAALWCTPRVDALVEEVRRGRLV